MEASVCVQQVERNHLLSLPRLLNNRMLELRQQFLSRPKKNRDQVVNLQQNLFGSINNKKENLLYAQEELAKMSQADCQRWNFDFDSGRPLNEEEEGGGGGGQYHWQLLDNTTHRVLDTSGRLTCLTTFGASSSSSSSNSSTSSATSPTSLPSSSSSSSLSSPSSKRAVTVTTFSTSTTPTPVISKKCVKRLQKSVNNRVPKLITDYFRESKSGSIRYQSKDESDVSVSNRLLDILKIRSMNVR